jgi:NADPH:quinone reductase-like Zn-dependent oxidoreductase
MPTIPTVDHRCDGACAAISPLVPLAYETSAVTITFVVQAFEMARFKARGLKKAFITGGDTGTGLLAVQLAKVRVLRH